MPKMNISTKRMQIDKANLTIVVVAAVAAFITVFSLVACKSLLSQRSYQSRVIHKKELAKDQINANVKAVATLQSAYKQFVESPENVIGGSATGAGDRDGDNAKIVLDALPSQYDFPALTSSLEKLITDKNAKIVSITGIDDEVNQGKTTDGALQPVQIPFDISVQATYVGTKDLIDTFERSIRPFNIDTLSLTAATDGGIVLDLTAKTYYQPAKTLNVKKEVVK
jgi:hypothetical protein